MQIQRKGNESFEAMMRRFFREIQQSGLLTGVKEKRYRVKPPSRRKMRESALRRARRLRATRGY